MIYILSFLYCIFTIYVYIKHAANKPRPWIIDRIIVSAILCLSFIPVANTMIAIFCFINKIVVVVGIKLGVFK